MVETENHNDLLQYVNGLLVKEDIEGFINSGAPSDEYLSEAEHIADAISCLGEDQINEEIIVSIISIEWARVFNLTAEDMALRAEAIGKVASSIIKIAD